MLATTVKNAKNRKVPGIPQLRIRPYDGVFLCEAAITGNIANLDIMNT